MEIDTRDNYFMKRNEALYDRNVYETFLAAILTTLKNILL